MARAVEPYERIHRPEVIDPRIADVEALARWMDYNFRMPGGFRFGFAGLLDLIPGIGDIIDAALSLYIVLRATQLGVPRITLSRMVLNVGIEALVGVVPMAGALFNFVFKANRRNYQLLRIHLEGNRRQQQKDWIFVILAALLVIAGIALPVLLLAYIVNHLW